MRTAKEAQGERFGREGEQADQAAATATAALASPVPDASNPWFALIVSSEMAYVCSFFFAIAASKFRCIAWAINSPPVCSTDGRARSVPPSPSWCSLEELGVLTILG